MRVTHSGLPKGNHMYEYAILLINPVIHDSDDVLNKWGQQRWRLVNIWAERDGKLKAVLMRRHKPEIPKQAYSYQQQ